MIYQKFVKITILTFNFEISSGAILYPLTFLISDLITEIFGRQKAKFSIKLAIFMNILVIFIISKIDKLSATSWSRIDDSVFHKVFSHCGISFLGSIIACYIAQSVDVFLYNLIKETTKNKYIWLRTNLSTSISLLIDTIIVIMFLYYFNLLEINQAFTLITNSFLWKFFFTMFSTPFFYLALYFIKLNKPKISVKTSNNF